MDHATTNPQNAVLTETEAAALLQVTRFALRKWRRSGLGPRFVRCGGRLIRYMQADIDSWLSQRKFNSNAHELSAAPPK